MSKQTYKAKIDLSFNYGNQVDKIQPETISYIMIESDYENKSVPIIYISLSVNSDLYSKIIRYKDSAKFNIRITKQNASSDTAISKLVLNDSFNYIPSTTNPNYTENLNDMDYRYDTSYRRIMIGLISVDLQNKLRQSFNSIYNNIDQNTLVGLAVEGIPTVIEPLTYNESYKSLSLPPINSRYKLLKHVFDKDPFYDTNFIYFLDFDRAYLMSKRGNPVDAGDGKLNNIIVDIRSVTAPEAYYEGMDTKNGAYYMYVNPVNTNVTLNLGTEKVANQLIGADDDGLTQKLDMNINNTQGSTTKHTFYRTSNAALIKNELETNSVIIELFKQHIDGSVFTPNKSIMVSNYGEYSKYNGRYTLSYKKEFFKCIAGEFLISCNIGLKKVGNIEPAKSPTNYNYDRSSATSSSAKTTTSSSMKTSLRSTVRNK